MKFEKQVSLKWAIALVLIACLVSSSIVYYVFGVSPSSAFTISGGVYPGAPCYTVWGEGGYYFAKDANGEIDYSGTNATTVINNALSTGAGRFFFKRGDYYITGGSLALEITHSNVVLEGETEESDLAEEIPSLYGGGVKFIGDGATQLLYIHGASRATALESIVIKNICFDGGASAQNVGKHLIHAKYVAELWIENCGLRRSADDGIFIEQGNEIMWIKDNDISLNYGSGIDIYADGANGLHYIHIVNNHLWQNQLHGIKLLDSGSTYLISGCVISGNEVVENYRHGILLQSVWNSRVYGNYIAQNDYLDTMTYSGVVLDQCNDVVVYGNRIHNNQFAEINLVGASCNNNTITDNDVTAFDQYGVYFGSPIGTGNNVYHNSGYNPRGYIEAPTWQASPWTFTNTYHGPIDVYISGGTISGITKGGQAIGTSGWIHLEHDEAIVITYTAAGTLKVFGQ